MAASNTLTAHVYIKGHDQASKAFGAVSKNINAVTGRINASAAKIQGFGRTISGGYSIPMALAFGASMRGAYNFAEAINQVAATAQLSEAQVAPYIDILQEFGRTTQYTAVESAQAFNLLLQAGSSLDEAVALLPETLNLAAAGTMSLAKAADYSTNAFAGFGLASDSVVEMRENMVHLNDVVTYTATKANTNVTQMFMAMREAGPVSNALGISLEKTSAILGVMGNNGFQGAAAGRSFRTGLLRLIAPTKKARAAFADLGIEYGQFFNNKNTLTGDKLSNSLRSQGINIKSGLLQNILENSESEDLLGELVEKVVSQVGDKSTEARSKISQIIAESFAVNAEGLDIFGLFKTMQDHDAGAAHMEAIFGKLQVAKFMALLNSDTKKGFIQLEKTIMEGADGASKRMSETQMRGMVGDSKRMKSAIEGLNLSIWDSGLADQVTEGIRAITGAIRELDDDDIQTLLSVGKALGGVVLTGAVLTGLGNTVRGVTAIGGALSSAAAGAAIFAPYLVAGGALIGGLYLLADAYEGEGKSSEFAAGAEKNHADQLERVNKILGTVTGKAKEYGEELDKSTRLQMRLEVAEMDNLVPKQRAEIVGNLLTSGWGASNSIADLDDGTKSKINQLGAKFEKGDISIEGLNDELYALTGNNIETAQALELVIKNVHALGMVVTDRAEKNLMLMSPNLSDQNAKNKINSSLTMVNIADNVEYQNLLGAVSENNEFILKILSSPTLKDNAHFKSFAAASSGFPMGSQADKDSRVGSLRSETAIMLERMNAIDANIKAQNTARKNEVIKAELEGKADVNIRIDVTGAGVRHQSTSIHNSGNIRAKNVGTSMVSDLEFGHAR